LKIQRKKLEGGIEKLKVDGEVGRAPISLENLFLSLNKFEGVIK